MYICICKCIMFTYMHTHMCAELVHGLVDRMGALRHLPYKIGTEDSVYAKFADGLDKLLTRW